MVHLLGRPTQALGVLAHLQSRYADTASVGCLARSVEDFCLLENTDGTRRRGHIGTFAHRYHAVGHEGAGCFFVDFVLRGRRQGDVGFLGPRFRSFHVFATVALGIFTDAAAVEILQLHDIIQFLAVNAVGVVDITIGVGHGEHLSALLEHLLGRVLRHIARARDEHGLALDVEAARLEHLLEEIHVAIACGLGTDKRTAKLAALAREGARKFARQFLVHAKHIANLASAHADVASGNVSVGTDVTAQFEHKGLAETHDLGIALATRREIRTALAAAHGERGEGILKRLFERQELEDAQVHRTVETNTSLVGANAVVVLHAVTHVGLHLALVVHPIYAKLVDAVGDAEALNEFGALELGMLVVFFLDGG